MPSTAKVNINIKLKIEMNTNLSDYDSLECPDCETLTKPTKVNKDESVTYKCKECEKVFKILANGDLDE